MATDPQTLLQQAKCLECNLTPGMAMLALTGVEKQLADQVVANGGFSPRLDCGTVENAILVSGAGDTLANGLYTAPSPGTWTNANGYYITFVITDAVQGKLYNSSGTLLYQIRTNFPCGTWTMAPGAPGGTAPPPPDVFYESPAYMTTGLVSFWRFEESVGASLDTLATAGNWGINIGGYLRQQGIIDYARFTPNINGGFTNTKTTPYNVGPGNSFTVAGWFNPVTDPNGLVYFAKWDNANDALRDYLVSPTAAFANPRLSVRTALNATVTVTATASLTGWHFIAFGFDATAQQIWISVDNGARQTQACTDVRATAVAPTIGVLGGSASGANLTVDSIGFWNKTLSSDQIIAMWNNGQGWDYPFDASRGGQVASRWSTRVVTNGGAAPSSAHVAGIATFVDRLVSAALLAKFRWINVFAPDNLTAAITPLLKGLGNDPWANTAFVAGDLTVNGLKGDGATKFLDTGCQPAVNTASNLVGFTVYNTLGNSNNEFEAGSADASFFNSMSLAISYGGNCFFDSPYTATAAGRTSVANGGWTGYLSANRIAANDARVFRANSSNAHAQLGATNTNAIAGLVNTFSTYIFRLNFTGGANWSTKRLSFIAYHEGLTQAQSLTLYNAVVALRTALGGGLV